MENSKEKPNSSEEVRLKVNRRRFVGFAMATAAVIGAGFLKIRKFTQLRNKRGEKNRATYSPLALSAQEFAALAVLVEAIIPRTETPGAVDAAVHEYIDLVMSVEITEKRKAFLDGLTRFEKRCIDTYKVSVKDAKSEQVVALLTDAELASKNGKDPFFQDLKERTIIGYYTSKKGWTMGLGLPESMVYTNAAAPYDA